METNLNPMTYTFAECSEALDRLIKRYILASELPNIFFSHFGPDVRTFKIEIIVYIKCDDIFIKHKDTFSIVLKGGSLLKPIFVN